MARVREIKRMVFQDLDGWGAERCSFSDYIESGVMVPVGRPGWYAEARYVQRTGWMIFDHRGKSVGEYRQETGELRMDGVTVLEDVELTIRNSVAYLWMMNKQRLENESGRKKHKRKKRQNGDKT